MTNRDRAWELVPSSLPQNVRSEIVDAVECALDEKDAQVKKDFKNRPAHYAYLQGQREMRERAAIQADKNFKSVGDEIRALPIEGNDK